ncbi:hypothetical protein SRHO_G00313190 [Serrasalmus rhombeus]
MVMRGEVCSSLQESCHSSFVEEWYEMRRLWHPGWPMGQHGSMLRTWQRQTPIALASCDLATRTANRSALLRPGTPRTFFHSSLLYDH